jgi:hypothetical protein
VTLHEDSAFLFNDRGELIQARLAPSGYEELSRTKLIEPTWLFGGRKVAWAAPAFAHQSVYARNDLELICVSLAANSYRTDKQSGMEVGKEMGVNTWAAFAGEDEKALVDGDFAMREEELQPVLKALRGGGVNVVAIHHHMTGETPRIIFLHFWGKDTAANLAKTLKTALGTQAK